MTGNKCIGFTVKIPTCIWVNIILLVIVVANSSGMFYAVVIIFLIILVGAVLNKFGYLCYVGTIYIFSNMWQPSFNQLSENIKCPIIYICGRV